MILRTLVLVLAMSPSAYAAENRSAEAHEHGVGNLNIAIDKNQIMMELEVPGSDIVGFEHAPTSNKDKQMVADAIRKLETIGEIIDMATLPECRLKSVEAELHIEDEDEHGDEKHHDDKADHKDEAEEQHAEFHANYNVECNNTASLQEIRFTYFNTFPNAKELEVQMVTSKGTKGAEITPSQNALSLN